MIKLLKFFWYLRFRAAILNSKIFNDLDSIRYTLPQKLTDKEKYEFYKDLYNILISKDCGESVSDNEIF